MLELHNSADPKKTLDELRKDFGSPQGLADAHRNFTESMMNCYSALMARSEPEIEQEKSASEETNLKTETESGNAPVQDADLTSGKSNE